MGLAEREPLPVAQLLEGMPQRLRKTRQYSGYALRGWADLLTVAGYPVTFVTVQQYETGARTPSLEYVVAVAAVVGADPLALMFGGYGGADALRMLERWKEEREEEVGMRFVTARFEDPPIYDDEDEEPPM